MIRGEKEGEEGREGRRGEREEEGRRTEKSKSPGTKATASMRLPTPAMNKMHKAH